MSQLPLFQPPKPITRIVYFSGGIGSWAAAKRVARQHGTEHLKLVFADTLIEDEDLYRFLHEAAENVGGELVVLRDGRTPWEVFRDVKFMGNSRVDPCSRVLKRDLLNKWRTDNYGPEECVSYVGIDWTESHRLERLQPRFAPYTVWAPMCERPLLEKDEVLAWARREGLEPPRLYGMGFAHNNCGGWCVKSGMAQFKLLMEKFPERYEHHEAQEEAFRELIGKDVSILTLRRTIGGEKRRRPLTMREFRHRLESGNHEGFDKFEWGGCGCAID